MPNWKFHKAMQIDEEADKIYKRPMTKQEF